MLNVISLLFGAMIGSCLNVFICRLPKEESIITPGSHCPQCSKPIRWYDNIPLVSFLLLRGKCRNCHRSISVQYPLVEGITALLSLLLFIRFGPSLNYVIYFAFVAALVVITVIDLHHQIIPDMISLPGIGVGLLASWILPGTSVVKALLGLLLGGGSLFLVATVYEWLFKREGMGGGDVKLLAMIGAFLGWKAVILTILLSSLIGSIVGIAVILWKGRDFKYAIPFGPFLSLGAVIALFYGENLILWYLTLNR
ncbi:MAG: type 4 prepilin peptidase 1, Aspartic peptidase, family [Deltaproteobacteria bacterium]|nr:type 4 prepilin peptidase 1, Aspartic peptidase, family [Deltaproteobacteria bacterium]